MQLAVGKVLMLVSVPPPPVMMSPAIGKLYEIHILIQLIIIVFEYLSQGYMLIELQIKITCWAIVSLAGGGLAKVEEGDCQGEKNHPSHLQQADLR